MLDDTGLNLRTLMSATLCYCCIVMGLTLIRVELNLSLAGPWLFGFGIILLLYAVITLIKSYFG